MAQAPDHVIENLKLGEKAKEGKKVVKRKAPRAQLRQLGPADL